MNEADFLQETPAGLTQNQELKNYEAEQNQLLKNLFDSSFESKKWIFLFSDFSTKYDRFLYSRISSSIISEESDDVIMHLLSNISTLIECAYEDKTINPDKEIKDEDFNGEIFNLSEKKFKLLYKLYDHCNLAIIQRAAYKETKDSIQHNVDESFEKKYAKEYDEHIVPKINTFQKDITAQLITLVSIFTALSFVIFGSINLLDSLFKAVESLPVSKTIIICDLWLICMLNIFLLFIKFIFIMTEKGTAFSLKSLLIWGNIVLILILFIIFAYKDELIFFRRIFLSFKPNK